MHCSSAGEFEQGKPLIEALKKNYPHIKLLVSFFSPSGYGVAKNYPYADYITFLPLDTRKNAERFVRTLNPSLVIFIKYEFWYHHLRGAAFRHIPVILASAVFRKDQVFFKPYGRFFRQILFLFRHIFVQDTASLALAKSIGVTDCTISGDTRFDRVAKIKEAFNEVELIGHFIDGKKVIVAGSTWAGDEELLAAYAKEYPEIKLILAPHEINVKHINRLQSIFPDVLLYSHLTGKPLHASGPTKTHKKVAEPNRDELRDKQVLITDSVGLLSRLYQYADVSYVGGGFTKDGIHNILEAAVWSKPVVFGPNYKKYREAAELIEAGGGFSVSSPAEIKKLLNDFFSNENYLNAAGIKAGGYIEGNTGATEHVIRYIQENRLLTRP